MIDMKYKVYCISAMMLCCVVSKAQEKDTVEVGDSVKKENVSRVWKNVKTRTIRGKVLSGTDKKPKGGAMVSTHGISGYSTLTEEDGTFKLDLPGFCFFHRCFFSGRPSGGSGFALYGRAAAHLFISSDRGTVVR